jgi:cell division transport system permease protein
MYFGYALISTVLACLLLAGLLYTANQYFFQFDLLKDWKTYGLLGIVLLSLAVIIVQVSTFFATKRYLRLKVDELY